MRKLGIPALVGGLTLAAAVALASPGGAPEPASPPPSTPSVPTTDSAQPAAVSPARAEAEQSYALAYEEVGKANKYLADGKAKNAQKMFKRALGRVENAVSLDPAYHEAWNLVGYSARRLGDYDKAFMAYGKCLDIKHDYAPAREYLGEAYVELGKPAKAREQLAWLERLSQADQAKSLRTQIESYETAHPGSTAAPVAPAAAPADSAIGSATPR